MQNPDQVRLLPASAWPPPESQHGEILLKLSYLRGLLDALQYIQLDPQTASRVLEGLKGKDLQDIAAEVDEYYLFDKQPEPLPPAAVLFRVLPGRAAGAAGQKTQEPQGKLP